MRNKHVRFELQGDSRALTPLKRNYNIKNREQLRRKLKDLLEKDQQLASDKKRFNVVQTVIKPVYKNMGMEDSQKDLFSLKGNGIKKKKKLTPINSTLKRKLVEKPITSNVNIKVFKMQSIAKNPVPNIYSKKSKPKKTTLQKFTSPEKLHWKTKPISQKVENLKPFNKLKRKIIPVPSKVEVSQLSELSLFEKEKLLNAKKRTKQIIGKPKKNEANRGPLRPNTPESNYKNKSIPSMRSPSKEDQQAQSKKIWENNDCESESSSSDATVVDEDFVSNEFDCSSTDSLCAYETDSEIENFSEGETDSTYKLPDHIPEDIYVAKGAAIKHDLSESNDVVFDSDESSAQVIEIMNKNQMLQNNRLLSATDYYNGIKDVKAIDKGYESPDSCPELVPIDQSVDIQDESDSDNFSDCLPVDFSAVDHTNTNQKLQMVPEIFKLDKNMVSDIEINLFNASNAVHKCEVEGSPLQRVANMKATMATFNVITVQNKKVIFNDNSQVDGDVNRSLVDGIKEGNVYHDHSDQLNGYAEKTKSPQVQKADQTLTKKPHDLKVVSKRVRDTSVRDKNNQSVLDNLVRPIAYEENSTYTNNFSKNKTQMKTLFFNAINSNQVIVLLKEPLYLYGTVKLKLLAGSLDIFGYNPKPEEILEVFSPRGYGSLKIEPSEKLFSHPINENELNALVSCFLKNDIETVRNNYDYKTDAIIILERNDNSKKVNMLRKYMIENLFPNMSSLQSDRPFYTSEFLLRCIITPTANQPLIINPIWRAIPMNDISRILVIGGKSVGKTTLTRYLANAYLNKSPKVLLIDLDIGQPEMFVPQTVSATTLSKPLLGPGYLSVKEPDKAFLVGQTNVVLLPQRYIQSVQALISFCRQNPEYNNIPWIVNTMGYNKGFGDEIIAVICRLLNPTNIVQLESKKEINNFDTIMSKENLKSMRFDIIGDMFDKDADYHPEHFLSLMTSVVQSKKYQNDWELNPRDMRLAMIISRLSAILKGHAEWLTDIKPVCASIDDLKLVNLGEENLNTEDLMKALIGNLVYMCKQNSNSNNECLGIGIVRGIDFPLKQIYLLPAIPLKLLEEVNCLAICGIPLPSSILINQGPKVKGVASYIYNTIDRSASMHIKQIYHRPQHFLTGKHKTVID